MAQKNQTIMLDWSEVRSAWLSAIEQKVVTIGENQPMYSRMVEYAAKPLQNGSFEGGSPHSTTKNILDGFRAKQFEHSAEYASVSERKHWDYDDEDGELDLDRVFDGYDEIFLERAIRDSRPGLRLSFEYAFACGTLPKVIAQYGAWCASLITSLEASGYDLVVDMWIHLDNLFSGERSTRTSVLIRVKEENILSNFTEWSALFGPTGYRHLGFLAKQIAGDKVGKTVEDGYGNTIGGQDWGVEYDREHQMVQVRVNQRAGASYFPGDRLNEDAIKAGLIPTPIIIAE